MEEEAHLRTEWLKKQGMVRKKAEEKRAAVSEKHRYGENAYLYTNRSFSNSCDETIEVTVNRNQICEGGTFTLRPGRVLMSVWIAKELRPGQPFIREDSYCVACINSISGICCGKMVSVLRSYRCVCCDPDSRHFRLLTPIVCRGRRPRICHPQ